MCKPLALKGCTSLWHNRWHLLLLAVGNAAGQQKMCFKTPLCVSFKNTGLTFMLSAIVWLQHSNSAAPGLLHLCCQCRSSCFNNSARL